MTTEQQRIALNEALNMAAVWSVRQRGEYRADKPITLAVSRYLDRATAADLVSDICAQLNAMGYEIVCKAE